MDELDYLQSRNQQVLYNFFDWPNRTNSRLIVIGIANTIDLVARYLPPKIVSRIGTCLCARLECASLQLLCAPFKPMAMY